MPVEIPPPSEATIEARSYNTIEEANAYFIARLHSELWIQATDEIKQAALNSAARIIDKFGYIGRKLVATQEHEFPRSGIYLDCVAITTVPNEIKIAECDIAYALLSGIDPEKEMRSMTVTSRGYSSVRITYDPKLIQEWLVYGVPSQSAWAYLVPYLSRDSSGSVKLHRVS